MSPDKCAEDPWDGPPTGVAVACDLVWVTAGDAAADGGPLLRGVSPSRASSTPSCLTELARLLMLLFMSCAYWSCPPYICPEAVELVESIVLVRLSMLGSAGRVRVSWPADWGAIGVAGLG